MTTDHDAIIADLERTQELLAGMTDGIGLFAANLGAAQERVTEALTGTKALEPAPAPVLGEWPEWTHGHEFEQFPVGPITRDIFTNAILGHFVLDGHWIDPTDPERWLTATDPYTLEMRFSRDEAPEGQTASWFHSALPLTEQPKCAKFDCSVLWLDDPDGGRPFAFGMTSKVGGLYAYHDQDMGIDGWPGGGNGGPGSFSSRIVTNHWTGAPGSERFGVIIAGQPDPRSTDDTRLWGEAYVSADFRAREWPLGDYGPPPLNQWIDLTLAVELGEPGAKEDKLAVWIDGEQYFEIGGQYLIEDGPGTITGTYWSLMFGGNDETYAPRTPNGEATAQIRNFLTSIPA